MQDLLHLKPGSKSGGPNNVPVKGKYGSVVIAERQRNGRWREHFSQSLDKSHPAKFFASYVLLEGEDARISADATAENVRNITIKTVRKCEAPSLGEIPAELLKKSRPSHCDRTK